MNTSFPATRALNLLSSSSSSSSSHAGPRNLPVAAAAAAAAAEDDDDDDKRRLHLLQDMQMFAPSLTQGTTPSTQEDHSTYCSNNSSHRCLALLLEQRNPGEVRKTLILVQRTRCKKKEKGGGETPAARDTKPSRSKKHPCASTTTRMGSDHRKMPRTTKCLDLPELENDVKTRANKRCRKSITFAPSE